MSPDGATLIERRSLTDGYFMRDADGNSTAGVCTAAPPGDQQDNDAVTHMTFRWCAKSRKMRAVDYSSETTWAGEAEVDTSALYIRLNGAVLTHAEQDAIDAEGDDVDTSGLCAVCVKWE